MAMSESQKRACEKYRKENIRQILIKVNRKTEPDLYNHLASVSSESLQGYIKSCIFADMKSKQGT